MKELSPRCALDSLPGLGAVYEEDVVFLGWFLRADPWEVAKKRFDALGSKHGSPWVPVGNLRSRDRSEEVGLKLERLRRSCDSGP